MVRSQTAPIIGPETPIGSLQKKKHQILYLIGQTQSHIGNCLIRGFRAGTLGVSRVNKFVGRRDDGWRIFAIQFSKLVKKEL